MKAIICALVFTMYISTASASRSDYNTSPMEMPAKFLRKGPSKLRATKYVSIAIDFGNSYTKAAYVLHDYYIDFITSSTGSRMQESIVAFTENGILVGEDAKEQQEQNASNTIFDIHRMLGKTYNEIADYVPKWPFTVVNKDGLPVVSVKVGGVEKQYTPEFLTAIIIKHMKKLAEKQMRNKVVKSVLLTVPSGFYDSQRKAMMDAAHIAGLDVLSLLNSPTAAALATLYEGPKKNMMVIDVGAAHSDASVITIDDGKYKVLSTRSTYEGGKDLDYNMVDYFAKNFKKKYGKDFRTDPTALVKMQDEIERAKRQLSYSNNGYAFISVDSLIDNIDFYEPLSKGKLEDNVSKMVRNMQTMVRKALDDIHMTKKQIKELLFVGGFSRMPKIERDIERIYNMKSSKEVNPDEAIAFGAAVYMGKLTGIFGEYEYYLSSIQVEDINSYSIGFGDGDNMSGVVKKANALPIVQASSKLSNDLYEGEILSVVAVGDHYLGNVESGPNKMIFVVDKSGILSLKSSTGDKIEIDTATGLTESDIDQLKVEVNEISIASTFQSKMNLFGNVTARFVIPMVMCSFMFYIGHRLGSGKVFSS